MEGIKLIESTELYNMLQQGLNHSYLSDINYLLLIDARNKNEYNESHIMTAKKAPKNEDNKFMIPYDAELECKIHVVVYDSNTSALTVSTPALDCANLLWKTGSRNPVMILKGGYEEFSALYPFLRTQKIIFTPRELDAIESYPIEVLQGLLYVGNWRHGNTPHIQKHLKIKGHINCCVEAETFFSEPGTHLLHIQVDDNMEADLFSHFKSACEFIDTHFEEEFAVLVFGLLGIGRCVTVIIAILIHHFKWTLQEAYSHMKKCNEAIKPNQSFMEQLSQWEEEIHGSKITDLESINY
ncbi:serine/threonine/tyrosine-interacting-like protein 1 isoform X1 [Biomphalaria glabrata]|uniref:Serine/threonine/tyrosine-interacting-like protein 1 isoform X1 n=2 Tax=Biomphalaria glabrata TaxID=6526 RepID=A0A9W2YFZ2_BIOGL|nr:serine/threonine/tyrosine-interacting-like protein 1 isoform X1 [Biomphalaria glabrata]